MKPWFRPLPETHGHHRLSDPVRDRRHPIADLVKVSLQIGFELLQGLPVHSRAPLFALTCRHASHTSCLEITNGLSFGFGMFGSASSQDHTAPVDRIDIPDQPAPSLHPHPSKQELHHYYGPARRQAPRLVLNAFGFCPARSLSRPIGPATPVVGIDARLLTFRAIAADQAPVVLNS
jgi:hypothetical protein